jgi:hypothetical protein
LNWGKGGWIETTLRNVYQLKLMKKHVWDKLRAREENIKINKIKIRQIK